MKAAQLLREGEMRLAHMPDAKWDARELLISVLGIPHNALVRHLSDDVSAQAEEKYRAFLERRANGEPAQYILGSAWFMGLEYRVDPRVLIPRQDTELLCEEALAFAQKSGAKTALDLCTGSGALAVALAKYGKLCVTATDLSADALAVAQENAKYNAVSIEFKQGDLFAAVGEETYDLIVCNPPYLTQQDMDELQAEVRKEPALALLGGADGLAFYRRLASEGRSHLDPGGRILMEIGCAQGTSVPALFAGWKTRVIQDLNGLDRVVEAIPE